MCKFGTDNRSRGIRHTKLGRTTTGKLFSDLSAGVTRCSTFVKHQFRLTVSVIKLCAMVDHVVRGNAV